MSKKLLTSPGLWSSRFHLSHRILGYALGRMMNSLMATDEVKRRAKRMEVAGKPGRSHPGYVENESENDIEVKERGRQRSTRVLGKG